MFLAFATTETAHTSVGVSQDFRRRYNHLFTLDELEAQNEPLEAYMGSYWKDAWAGKSLEEAIELGKPIID